ncbi:MAG: hypothetical protein CL928_09670 [Deltaproteobacteria bacterium]|nr:hypothetical protein [Deltaproteobacteria bacterium]
MRRIVARYWPASFLLTAFFFWPGNAAGQTAARDLQENDSEKSEAAVTPSSEAPETSGEAARLGPGNSPVPHAIPDLLDAPSPGYPEEALASGIEGAVVLALQLDENGVVQNVEIVREPGGGLGEAAAAATRDSIFESPPAQGPPHELRRYFHVVRFVLPDEARAVINQAAAETPEQTEESDTEDIEESPQPADELTVFPELMTEVSAPYPEAAREEGVQGQVLLELDVSATGDLDAVRLVSADPSGWGLELAAVKAAWQFRFSPAYAGAVPVPVRITYTYGFQLQEQVVLESVEGPKEGESVDPDGPVNLSGTVRERGTRRALGGVEVLIEKLSLSAVTDDFGYFQFRGIPAGLHRVLVAVPGYRKFETEEEIRPGQATDVVYFVRESPLGVPETVVRTQREKKEVARRTIAIETIERVPGTFGDPVRIVQNLPGVARSPFDFGLLIVRGSGPEDSGAHIDGIRVPQLFHFGGFRSIVTPILLDSIDFYPGGYGARYGRLTGGILDVRTRERYEDQIHGLVQADLLDASAALTGSIRKKGDPNPIGGFVVAARRSYLDVILPALTPSSVDLSSVVFPQWTDIQGKLTLRPGDGHSLSWLAYFSQDRAGSRVEDPGRADIESTQGDFLFKNDFWRAAIDWTYRSRSVFSNRLVFSVGQDFQHFDVGQFASVDVEAFWLELRDEARLDIQDWLELVLGADIISSVYAFEFKFNDFDVRTFGNDPNAEREELVLADEDFGITPAAFLEGRFKLADERVQLVPGVRLDYYVIPGQFSFVTGDPRFAFRVSPDPDRRLEFKGSVGLYHQNPQGYELLEVTGNTELKPEQSVQFSLGTEIRFTDFLSLDLQGFYKRLQDLVVFSSSGVLEDGSDSAWMNTGDGHIYGAELFLRCEPVRGFEGWVALTLQRSQRRDRPNWDFYWYDFDQPIILDIVASYQLPFGFKLGARWRYVSGNPTTPVMNAIYDADDDSYIPLQGTYNSERLPDFHALDIRIDKDFNFRTWKLTVYLDILNVYNRQNPESVVHNFDYTEKTYLYSLPIIPNLGFKGQF